ncbi:MAG TPA: cytosine permease [Candidatus Dormibacteraeota bacterium]|nr:cytosine permease [Candidatus Dormibacteraeota bacterium]
MSIVDRPVVERYAPTDEFLKVETHGIEPIPSSERKGLPRDVAWLWVAAFANFVSLITGALLVTFGLGVGEAIVAVATGSVLAAALHGLLSVAGPRFGTTQVVAARNTFGLRGAYGGAFFTLFLAVGWFAVDCVIAAQALVQLARLAGLAQGNLLNAGALLVVVVLSVLVAVYGHQTITVFEKYGAIVFVVFCAVLGLTLLPKVNWALQPTVTGADHLAGFVLGTSVIFALVASWFSFASDYSRYLPQRLSDRSVAGWIGAGTAISMFAFGALGVLLASIDPKAGGNLLGLISANAPLAVVVPFLVFIAVGEVWANYLDVYTAGLSALALNLRVRRWTAALAFGAIGGVLAYVAMFISNFKDQYTNFLLITYLWVPSWAAVVLVDMFVFKRRPPRVVPYSGRAVLAWLIGLAAAIPFVDSSLWQSPLAVHVLHNTDISGYVGAIVGGAAYLGLGRR